MHLCFLIAHYEWQVLFPNTLYHKRTYDDHLINGSLSLINLRVLPVDEGDANLQYGKICHFITY